MEEFERWYLREHPRVLSVCAALTGEVDEAGEATDEAFARALERWPRVRAMASPGGWVQVVALNRLRRNLRRRAREQRAVAGAGGPDLLTANLPDPELWAAVAALAPRQRAAIVLRYVHDLPEAAIAEAMGIARGTVASTLAAGRAGLAQQLGQPVSDGPTPNQEALG